MSFIRRGDKYIVSIAVNNTTGLDTKADIELTNLLKTASPMGLTITGAVGSGISVTGTANTTTAIEAFLTAINTNAANTDGTSLRSFAIDTTSYKDADFAQDLQALLRSQTAGYFSGGTTGVNGSITQTDGTNNGAADFGAINIGSLGAAAGTSLAGLTARNEDTFDITSANYTSTGNGVGASFSVVVDDTNAITDIIVTNGGSGYSVGDEFTILGSVFGGTDGVDDLTITIPSGFVNTNQSVPVTPEYSTTLQLLKTMMTASKTSVFDLNSMSELSAAPADKYAMALEDLRSLGESSAIGIAELTQRTTDVQVESGKLEMVNGVIKNAVNYLNGRAIALTS